KALVVYDTMWQSTETMARAVGEGLAAGGAHARLLPLKGNHRSDVVTELLDAGALVVGSPTLNNNIFPTVADTMTYVKGLRPKNLLGGVFGSYGWSGEAPKQLAAWMNDMDVEVINDPLRVRYVPQGDGLSQCYQLGLDVADRLTGALAVAESPME
ncbi:MAG: flavodoxin domain-containing protein, partial [Planctomycetota bacterium]